MANEPATATLKEKVGQLIVEHMNSGEKLPTERELVERFGVSRTTLREALSVSEASGIITSLQGSGRYVQTPNLGTQIMDTWSLLLDAKPSMILELLEIRRMLEINSLPTAMEAITMEQLQMLKTQVDSMKERAAQGKTFAKNDRQFHNILFSSTKNTLLEQLLGTFWDLYADANMEEYHEDLEKMAQQHEDILNAFARKDLDAVTALMDEQFTDSRYRIVVSLMNTTEEKSPAAK